LIKGAIENLESRYRTKVFLSVEECKSTLEESLQNFLETAIQKPYNDTIEKWDGKGKPHG
jgi:hypothetical protein